MSFQSNKQYLTWKLRSSAKILDPVEVNEVDIAASGSRRRGQDPGKKKSGKNSVICNFWDTQRLYAYKAVATNALSFIGFVCIFFFMCKINNM